MRKVVSWDEYFMKIAEVVAIRSKDESTQVGSVVVKDGRIAGTGFNGMPSGYPETPEDWEKPAKYQLVIHSENNAIIHSKCDLKGAKLYVTLSPCQDCAKIVVSSGIKEVYYKETRDEYSKALEYLNKCGVTTKKVDV